MVNRALTKTTFIRPCLNFASAIPRTLERVANNFLTLKINTFTIYRSICDSKLILTGFPVLNYERLIIIFRFSRQQNLTVYHYKRVAKNHFLS